MKGSFGGRGLGGAEGEGRKGGDLLEHFVQSLTPTLVVGYTIRKIASSEQGVSNDEEGVQGLIGANLWIRSRFSCSFAGVEKSQPRCYTAPSSPQRPYPLDTSISLATIAQAQPKLSARELETNYRLL